MSESIWVFGYGSLLWCQGFQFSSSVPGVIKGFSRRFYQGNETHRGRPGKPGRVATLIEDSQGETWGVAYEVSSPDALSYLDQREVHLGGYTTLFVEFHPADADPFPVLVYLARSDSCHWLGRAPDEDIADQILSSSGSTGHNVEYLLRLAEYVRCHAPDARDDHLFQLESIVRRAILDRGLSLQALMGGAPPTKRSHQENLPSKPIRCLGI